MCASRNYSQKMPDITGEELGRRIEKLFPFWVDKESRMCFELEKGDSFWTFFGRERKFFVSVEWFETESVSGKERKRNLWMFLKHKST